MQFSFFYAYFISQNKLLPFVSYLYYKNHVSQVLRVNRTPCNVNYSHAFNHAWQISLSLHITSHQKLQGNVVSTSTARMPVWLQFMTSCVIHWNSEETASTLTMTLMYAAQNRTNMIKQRSVSKLFERRRPWLMKLISFISCLPRVYM